MANSREDLKGQPLNDMERDAMELKAEGLDSLAIADILDRDHRRVQESLTRVKFKMGCETPAQSMAQFSEAATLRKVVKGIGEIRTLEELRMWQMHLIQRIKELDPLPVEPLCDHGKNMVTEVCRLCIQESTRHTPTPVEYWHPWNGKRFLRCTKCRRYPANHHRRHREGDKRP